MISLNSQQQHAVTHREGPLLLLAGAGSGKTRVITQRIVQMVQDGTPPDSILAVTFTNRAAREMADRIDAQLPTALRAQLVVSTFHALGVRLLRAHASRFQRTQGFVIYDADDQKAVVKRILKAEGRGTTAAEIRDVTNALSKWKSDRAVGRAEHFVLGVQYEAELCASNAFDFDDLILKSLVLLQGDAAIRARYQSRWQHVCVDEFQDTNAAQYAMIRCLCPPQSDLVVVGDDDQSIYGWRGAQVGNILAFSQDYPTAQTIRLEQNYRSTREILEIANRVIGHNQGRLGKELWTERSGEHSVQLHDFGNQRDEAEFVANEIARLKRKHQDNWSDFAVLVRANHLSLDFETALRRQHIPYRIVRGRSFYERAEVRDALSLLRVSVNPDDSTALIRLVGRWVRGVGKKSLERLEVSNRAHERSLWQSLCDPQTIGQIRGRGRSALQSFVASLQSLHAQVEQSAIDHFDGYKQLLTELGILDELRLHARDEQERQRAENVLRLLTEIQAWMSANPDGFLATYLEQTALVSDVDGLDESQDNVSILTVHAAKGLEFSKVFVVGLEEDVFPHARAKKEGDVEEERRLFYVAVTRAMDQVFLTRSRIRRTFAELSYQRPSRFLDESLGSSGFGEKTTAVEYVPTEDWTPETVTNNAYRVGQSVWHGQYGAGKVKGLPRGRNGVMAVSFPDVGLKKIMSDFLSPYDDGDAEW